MNIKDIQTRLEKRLSFYKKKLRELVPDEKHEKRLDHAEKMILNVLGADLFQALMVKYSVLELEHTVNTIKDWRTRDAERRK